MCLLVLDLPGYLPWFPHLMPPSNNALHFYRGALLLQASFTRGNKSVLKRMLEFLPRLIAHVSLIYCPPHHHTKPMPTRTQKRQVSTQCSPLLPSNAEPLSRTISSVGESTSDECTGFSAHVSHCCHDNITGVIPNGLYRRSKSVPFSPNHSKCQWLITVVGVA